MARRVGGHDAALFDGADGDVVPLSGIVIYVALFEEDEDSPSNALLTGERFESTEDGVAEFDLAVEREGRYRLRALTDDLRARMGQAAVALASNIGYSGAGTIEFLLDPEGNFYFMEMNTRIQVEHPVTEMVTSFDLVKEQIRVAAGERLSFQGDGRRLRGHAIECRINAEDPYRNFQPCPGLITAYHPPGGPGVRVDTHVYAGYTVPPYYDSLLAKVIVHGNDREEALTRMGQALDSFILEGVTTTIPFLARVIRHPDFVAGRVDTRFLERESHLLRPDA